MKILIAEDDPVSLRVLQVTLEKAGYAVTLAGDGQEAWKLFDAKEHRIVVSDWMMPGLDGLALCAKVREPRPEPYTYFILLTAKSEKEYGQEAMVGGVDDFLEKPFKKEALFNRLRVAQRVLGLTAEIQQLKGLLPICSYCKKFRDEKNEWQPIERYLSRSAATDCSHTYCPECLQKHVQPQLNELRARKGLAKPE